MNLYLYEGPVIEFERCVERQWKASTYAVSEDKARSNLAFQFKKNHDRIPSAKIALPGKLVVIQGKG